MGGRSRPGARSAFRSPASTARCSSTFLRLSAGGGITEPSLIQNFARESYAVGNPNLRPERTTSYEAGLVQEWFGQARPTSEVSVFDNSFRDLITYVSLPPPVWGCWRNVEASRARGLEVLGPGPAGSALSR